MGGWLHSAGAKAAAGAVAVAALGAIGFAAYGYFTEASLGAVSPLAGASVRSATPAISVDVSNAGHLGRYTVRVDGRDVTTASSMAHGAIRLDGVHLRDGRHTVSVTAHGNGAFGGSLDRSWAFVVDTHAPPLRLGALPTGWVREHSLQLSGHTQPGARVTAAANVATAHATATADGSFALSLDVSDGTIPLVVTATDAAGNRTEEQLRFVVDSTEHLGDATLRRGAVGQDVSDLQKLLRRQGYLHGPATGVYASGTVAAVKAFQKASDLPIDGAVGIYTLGALSGRIVIDQSAHLLTLERFGHPPVSFPVALGQPAYPTPDGHFTIISKVENPTWVPPPDAPWAQGAVPIPPGPGNPLGTRWMGLSAPGVGIHGTDDPGSIGYSVSHGCIRMQVPDAERLFTMVSLGMGVYIHA